MYTVCPTIFTHNLFPTILHKWETDLNLQADAIDWAQIWKATKSASLNIITLKINYKVLTRWYLVTAGISKNHRL